MIRYSELEILEGIAKDHTKIIEYVYDTCFPVIENFVLHNQGSTDHAKDVFQEAMIVVYRKLKNDKLSLSCKFSTYLYSVCKKIWIQERKKVFSQHEKLKTQPLIVQDSGEEDSEIDQGLIKRLLEKHLATMSPDCRKIMELSFNDYSVEEIKNELNYKTLHHAIDRKYRCKKSLIKRIINDPAFKKIKNEKR